MSHIKLLLSDYLRIRQIEKWNDNHICNIPLKPIQIILLCETEKDLDLGVYFRPLSVPVGFFLDTQPQHVDEIHSHCFILKMRWSDDLDLGTGQVQDVAGPSAGPFVSIIFTDSQSLRHEICDVISNSKQRMARHARQPGWKSVKNIKKNDFRANGACSYAERWLEISFELSACRYDSIIQANSSDFGWISTVEKSNSVNRRISEVQATCTSCFVHILNLPRTSGSR